MIPRIIDSWNDASSKEYACLKAGASSLPPLLITLFAIETLDPDTITKRKVLFYPVIGVLLKTPYVLSGWRLLHWAQRLIKQLCNIIMP